MENIYNFNDFINEDAHIASRIKLRDAIHDLFVDELEYGEEIKLDYLSKRLKEKFKISISEEILDKLIFEDWWRKNDYSIFRSKDVKWLDVWPSRNTLERKKPKNQPPLGKSKRKIKREEDNKKNYGRYGSSYYGYGNDYYGGYNKNKWKK